MSEIDTLVQAILARGSLVLSPAERAALQAGAAGHVAATKILCADAFNSGDYATAVSHAQAVYRVRPDAENTQNLISALSRAARLDEAIDLALSAEAQIDELRRATHLAEFYGRKGDFSENRKWGKRALKLKDRAARHLAKRDPAVKHKFNPDRPERNIISYSLFGSGARYMEGAMRNAAVARYLYPGWTARFYIDERVPMEVRRALEEEGAQLKQVPSLPADRYGLYWRFLVEDDPEVDIYIVRDADSVPNIRERAAVAAWLKSGKPFHVMRDYATHAELVLAGMWGAHRGNIPRMGQRILGYAKGRAGVLNSRVDDQLFLRDEVWPFMRGRVFVNDSAFGYGESAPFDPAFALPGHMHVGQDDHASRANEKRLKAARRSAAS